MKYKTYIEDEMDNLKPKSDLHSNNSDDEDTCNDENIKPGLCPTSFSNSVEEFLQPPKFSINLATESSNSTHCFGSTSSHNNGISSAAECCATISPSNCSPLKDKLDIAPDTSSCSARSLPTVRQRPKHIPNFRWPRNWPGQSSQAVRNVSYEEPRLCYPDVPAFSLKLPERSSPAPRSLMNTNLQCGVKMPIAGITLEFPHEPYPVQKYMMCQLISAIKKASHCLLESPTGTGKTLALLCSSLAWQQQEEELMRELRTSASYNMNDNSNEVRGKTLSNSDSKEQTSSGKKIVPDEKVVVIQDSDSDDGVFQSPKRKKKTADCKGSPEKSADLNKTYEEMSRPIEIKDQVEMAQSSNVLEVGCGIESFRPPKIYYGTRTHKQITQVVEQLKKTSYASKVKMTILAARDHTCVNNQVCKQPNVTQSCQALIDPVMGLGCSYYTGSCRGTTHQSLRNCQLPPVYDIEDIVSIGKKHKICPYFTLRNLVVQSDIVFCPYNYLIDPIIRESMNINVNKSVVIMDEAHNIEDTCREAGSLWIRQWELAEAIQECEDCIKRRNNPVQYNTIKDYLLKLDNWLSTYGPMEQFSEANESLTSRSGHDIIWWLDSIGISEEVFIQLKETVALINQKKTEFPDENESMTGKVKLITSAIITVLGFLYKPENTGVYQAYFFREISQRKSQSSSGSWLSKQSKTYTERLWQFSLHLICLSPAVVFGELLNARSIILASGTLSPLDTFQSELGVEFPHVVKGFHVVPRQNIFVSAVEFGPQKYPLKGVFENANKYEYQDELGRAILDTAKIIPHGVLCFFTSYSLMDKLKERWQSVGLIREMENFKELFWEPRFKSEMDNTMLGFNERVELSVDNPSEEIGAIMFGVFRGKIAEGIDFSDNYARAVIAVGIPFMNMHSKEVNLKMKFNDRNTNTRKKVLTGSHWYRIQAYRALNQALGRCIRHRNDWGAVILMDSRMCSTENQANLPRWIQNEIQPFYNWESYLQNISSFCKKMEKTQNDTQAAAPEVT